MPYKLATFACVVDLERSALVGESDIVKDTRQRRAPVSFIYLPKLLLEGKAGSALHDLHIRDTCRCASCISSLLIRSVL